MNDWTAIRAHYRLYGKEILSSPKNEWAREQRMGKR